MVGAMYAESMMTIMDNMKDSSICHQMRFVEFLVFLCRITNEHYMQSEHKDELLYKKLDHMLPVYLNHIGLSPTFQYDEKFKAEIK